MQRNDLIPQLIDVHASFGTWPTRRMPDDEPQRLVDRLRRWDVREAWVGHLDGVFHDDPSHANTQLLELCSEVSGITLTPMGTINLSRPNWQEELTRCHEELGMPGVRLYPSYHGYAVDDAVVPQFMEAANKIGVLVTLVAKLEDERMMHPLIRVPPLDLTPFLNITVDFPGVPIVLLNALKKVVSGSLLAKFAACRNVYFDIGWLEGLGALDQVVEEFPYERLLFGSFAPVFYFEAALLKFQESTLGHQHRSAIAFENARQLLNRGN